MSEMVLTRYQSQAHTETLEARSLQICASWLLGSDLNVLLQKTAAWLWASLTWWLLEGYQGGTSWPADGFHYSLGCIARHKHSGCGVLLWGSTAGFCCKKCKSGIKTAIKTRLYPEDRAARRQRERWTGCSICVSHCEGQLPSICWREHHRFNNLILMNYFLAENIIFRKFFCLWSPIWLLVWVPFVWAASASWCRSPKRTSVSGRARLIRMRPSSLLNTPGKQQHFVSTCTADELQLCFNYFCGAFFSLRPVFFLADEDVGYFENICWWNPLQRSPLITAQPRVSRPLWCLPPRITIKGTDRLWLAVIGTHTGGSWMTVTAALHSNPPPPPPPPILCPQGEEALSLIKEAVATKWQMSWCDLSASLASICLVSTHS